MIILDTNVVSEAMKPSPEPRVMAWLRSWAPVELGLTAVTVAEIRYGIRRLPESRRRKHLETSFHAFIVRGFSDRILPFDMTAAEIYAEIAAWRSNIGRPIDAFDGMIAAVARANSAAAVATRNGRDFDECDITVIDPWAFLSGNSASIQ